jgi:hypothetical protein
MRGRLPASCYCLRLFVRFMPVANYDSDVFNHGLCVCSCTRRQALSPFLLRSQPRHACLARNVRYGAPLVAMCRAMGHVGLAALGTCPTAAAYDRSGLHKGGWGEVTTKPTAAEHSYRGKYGSNAGHTRTAQAGMQGMNDERRVLPEMNQRWPLSIMSATGRSLRMPDPCLQLPSTVWKRRYAYSTAAESRVMRHVVCVAGA